MGEDSNPIQNDSTPIPIIDQPSSSSQPKKKQPSKKAPRQEAEIPQVEAEHEESIPTPSNDPQPSGEDSMQLTDLMEVGSQSLETDEHVKDSGLKRLRKISMTRRVESSEDQESLGAPEDASKQGRFLEDDKMHVEAKVNGKDEQSTKPDDSTAGEAVTIASVDDSVVPTTIEEITSKRVQNSTRDTTFKFLKIKEKLVDAELLEEQKLTRKQEKEDNIALIESWENTQAMMEADRLLAERLQSKERDELTDEEKANLIYDDREKRETILLHFRA
ncbi:hypothetical protein Tco_1316354 [Tanacetum coccineum]